MSTTTAPARPSATSQPFGASKVERKGNILVKWITSTDHKVIGYLYLITSFIYFLIGGVMALIIRAQLFEPGSRSSRRVSSTTSCSRCTARSCC
jgi:cytochrome c oxidase subunit 1